jgi:hypothetical protein
MFIDGQNYLLTIFAVENNRHYGNTKNHIQIHSYIVTMGFLLIVLVASSTNLAILIQTYPKQMD